MSDALNIEENRLKAAIGMQDEKMLRAQWGGGDSIIGAPRYPDGSTTLIPKHRIPEIVLQALNVQIN